MFSSIDAICISRARNRLVCLDDHELMAEAATLGLGIAYVNEHVARPYIERRRLRTVLEDWCPRIPGAFLYYPGHRHVPPGLKALIGVMEELSR